MDFSNPYVSGYAVQTISVNSPPSSGYMEVNPSSGDVTTTFSFYMKGASDEDIPISYQFLVVNNSNHAQSRMHSSSSLNYFVGIFKLFTKKKVMWL